MAGNKKYKDNSLLITISIFLGIAITVLIILQKFNFLPQTVSPVSATTYREAGWDPGIFKKCGRSAPPGALVVPYNISENCDSSGNFWQIGFRSENSYNSAGCNNFDISSASTPIKFDWSRRADNGYNVQILTDFNTKTHPCGANFFNWLVFMDQNSFFPYPKPDKLATTYRLWYDSLLPQGVNGGASRVIVGWQGFWDGKAREIEMSVYLEGWGDADPDPRVVTTLNVPGLQYVHAYGGPYDLLISKGQDKDLFVNWGQVINNLIASGYLDRPSDWNNTATAGIWAGVETNNKTASQSIQSNLQIKDFRVLDTSPAPTAPPPAPTNEPDILTYLRCDGYNPSTIIEWARAPFPAEYDLYRDGVKIATRADNAFKDDTTTNNVYYKYYVVMRGSGVSQTTSTKEILTPSCAPVKSLRLEARCNSTNPNIPSVRAYWERPDNFNRELQNFTYLLQRKLISGTGRSVDFEINPGATDFEETRDDLGPDSIYQYNISIINREKISSPVISGQIRTLNCPS